MAVNTPPPSHHDGGDEQAPLAAWAARPANPKSAATNSTRAAVDSVSVVDAQFASILWHSCRPDWTQTGWWQADLRPQVRHLLQLPAGDALHRALTDLDTTDHAMGVAPGHCPYPHSAPTLAEQVGVPGAPCACQTVTVAAWATVASWVAAQADAALIAVAGAEPVEKVLVPTRPDLGTITDPCIEELAPALRVSPGSASHRLGGLRRITALPRLQEAVASGLVIGWHAHLLATDLRHLPLNDQTAVIESLVDRLRSRRHKGLREWTCTDLRAQAKRIAARLDLDLAARREACHQRRGVRLRLHGQGAATLTADLADDKATRIFNRVTALAYGLPADCDGDEGRRSLDQRRADVFIDLLLGAPPEAESSAPEPDEAPRPSSPSTATEVAVVIDAETLLRLAANPGEVPGCGPVAAQIAREIAADARWRLWITNSTRDQVVATSPGTYRPTAALARLIRAREPECRMPGCRSRITDLDHVVPFPHGQTTPDNLGPLCRRHHRLKTHSRWRQQTGPSDGDADSSTDSWTWTTPAGIAYNDLPEPPLR